jgi:hypothetical protein
MGFYTGLYDIKFKGRFQQIIYVMTSLIFKIDKNNLGLIILMPGRISNAPVYGNACRTRFSHKMPRFELNFHVQQA